MSMTSKVKAEVRNAIIAFLKPGTTATNNGLKFHVLPTVSLRSIQEATQKLTRENILVQERSKGQTWYGLVPSQFIVEVRIDGNFKPSQNLGLRGQKFPSIEKATAAMNQFGSKSLQYQVAEVAPEVK